jgi:hypothetical protein
VKHVKLLANKLRKEYSTAWKLLAAEMEKEFREKAVQIP